MSSAEYARRDQADDCVDSLAPATPFGVLTSLSAQLRVFPRKLASGQVKPGKPNNSTRLAIVVGSRG